jgi:hypothetical protein
MSRQPPDGECGPGMAGGKEEGVYWRVDYGWLFILQFFYSPAEIFEGFIFTAVKRVEQ